MQKVFVSWYLGFKIISSFFFCFLCFSEVFICLVYTRICLIILFALLHPVKSHNFPIPHYVHRNTLHITFLESTNNRTTTFLFFGANNPYFFFFFFSGKHIAMTFLVFVGCVLTNNLLGATKS